MNDAKEKRAKWGYRTNVSGSTLTLKLGLLAALHPSQATLAIETLRKNLPFSTAAADGAVAEGGGGQLGVVPGPKVNVQVLFLKTYDRAGKAQAACSGGEAPGSC